MKDFFVEEVKKTVDSINSCRAQNDICFVMLTDTHMSDLGKITRENIKAVDDRVNFDFFVHLGGVINGNNPQNVSMDILKSEIKAYKSSIKSDKLFVIPGETDGYRDERFMGQLMLNMMTDELWYSETSYLEEYSGLNRPKNKPYYYVDCKDKKLRMIFMSSYMTFIDEENGLFAKYRSFALEQLAWLKNEALNAPEGYAVLLFSNAMPKSKYETGRKLPLCGGYLMEQTTAIVQQAKNRGVDVACWFVGYYNCDDEDSVGGVNVCTIASQLPTTKTKSVSDDVRMYSDREFGINTDLWDAVLFKPNERKIYLYRFGAGEDRVIEF